MTNRSIQNGAFLLVVAITTLAFFGLIEEFIQPLLWAAVFAVLFHPMQRYWKERFGGRSSVAAIVTVVLIIFIVLLPIFFVGLAVAEESMRIYRDLSEGAIDFQQPVRTAEQYLPALREYAESFGIDTEGLLANVSSMAVGVSQFLASQALIFGQNAIRVTAMVFLMLYVLFFFLRDGEALLATIIWALPLGDDRERKLITKFGEVARATIKGTLVVGVVQGSMGGLIFWILGIPAPVIWGLIMTFLSLLPAVGSAIVWLPVAVVLLLTGEVVDGLILIVVGTLIIGLVDNVLRPILVGRDTQMPDFLILISTLGGLTVFGLSGFVIGPVIAAFFLVIWQMFGEEYAESSEVVVGSEHLEPAVSEGDPEATGEGASAEAVSTDAPT